MYCPQQIAKACKLNHRSDQGRTQMYSSMTDSLARLYIDFLGIHRISIPMFSHISHQGIL